MSVNITIRNSCSFDAKLREFCIKTAGVLYGKITQTDTYETHKIFSLPSIPSFIGER